MDYIVIFVFPLILTLAVELPIYFAFKRDSMRYFLTIYLMNVILNLVMNYLLLYVFTSSYVVSLIVMEALIFIIEGTIVASFKSVHLKGYLASALANGASLGIGLLANYLVGGSYDAHLWLLVVLLAIFLVEVALFATRIIKPSLFSALSKRG